VYPAFLLVSITFFDADTSLDRRILAPAFVTVLGLAVVLAWRGGRIDRLGRAGRAAMVAACLILAGVSLHRGVGWVVDFRRDGAGYNGRLWRECRFLDGVRRLPEGLTIYTNARQAIRVNTGRASRELARTIAEFTRRPRGTYESDLAKMAAELRAGSAVLVYVWAHESVKRYTPSRAELLARIPLRAIETFPDGAIYEWAGGPVSAPGE
jgi:hypothetical protein